MALNFSLDSLLEQSLLTEDPWWVYILNGAWWTIGLTIAALALLIGIIVGTLRTAPNKFVRGLCEAWIELFRNIPLIVQIFIWYFVVPELVPWYKDWLIEVDPAVGQFVTAFICMGSLLPRVLPSRSAPASHRSRGGSPTQQKRSASRPFRPMSRSCSRWPCASSCRLSRANR